MGFFSFLNSDTGESIKNRFSSGGSTVTYMLNPKGKSFFEPCYEGYGFFGGINCFVFWMELNHPETTKGKSSEEIENLFFDLFIDEYEAIQAGEKDGYPLKFASQDVDYFSVDASKPCPDQGL